MLIIKSQPCATKPSNIMKIRNPIIEPPPMYASGGIVLITDYILGLYVNVSLGRFYE